MLHCRPPALAQRAARRLAPSWRSHSTVLATQAGAYNGAPHAALSPDHRRWPRETRARLPPLGAPAARALEPLAARAPEPARELAAASERTLASMGSGEIVHVISYAAKDGERVGAFEATVQTLARKLHEMESGVSDVRVCQPQRGEATFVVTLLTRADSHRFEREIEPQIARALRDVSAPTGPSFSRAGARMPQAHSLSSLVARLQTMVRGKRHTDHDVPAVRHEIGRWFPRREEYAQYAHWDAHDPTKYTRNLVYSSPEMEVLLMCWPAGARSLVHCHDESSCWVSLVEGQVHEVQYDAPPGMDGDFFARAMHDPDGAVGRCGPLRVSSVAALGAPGEPTGTYANNELGLHAIENRSARDAITLHVYAPRLRRMKVFRDAGADGSIASVASVGTFMSEMGEVTGRWRADTDPDGLIDVTAWNRPCTP